MESEEAPEQQIDQSAKFAFSFFVASAGLWLLAAALLAYIASVKLTDPLFLSSWEFLTYGKIKISQANALSTVGVVIQSLQSVCGSLQGYHNL